MEYTEKIRPLYMQIQGSLSQIPLPTSSGYQIIDDPGIWEQFNSLVDELSKITSSDYSEFRVDPKLSPYGDHSDMVGTVNLRQRMSGLVSKLYGEYFHGEPAPFGGTPSTVINASSHAETNLSVRIVNDVRTLIKEKEREYRDNPKELAFLVELNKNLSEVTDTIDLVKKIFGVAKSVGLSAAKLAAIFST